MSLQNLPRRTSSALLLGLAVLLPASAMAQSAPGSSSTSVWRCGDGRYSSAPCPGGTALDATDPRSAEQREQTRAAVAADKAQAERLAAERQARERSNSGAKAVNLSAGKTAPTATTASASKAKDKAKQGPGKSAKPRPAKKAKTPRA